MLEGFVVSVVVPVMGVFLLLFWSRLRTATKGLDRVKDQLEALKIKVEDLERKTAQGPASPAVELVPAELPSLSRPANVPSAAPVVPRPSVQPFVPPPQVPRQPAKASQNQNWKRWEKILLENAAALLGVLGLVAGIGFLAVYTALMLSPVFRVLGLVLLSIVLFASGAVLFRRKKWPLAALGLQSAAASLFLLACLGSGGLPGLQWIDQPLVAFFVLLLGVAANLGLALIRQKQWLATIHGLAALAALAVAGLNSLILVALTVTAVASLLLAPRSKWEIHGAVVGAAYALLLVTLLLLGAAVTEAERWLGAAGLAVVFLAGQGLHYRKILASHRWEPLPVVSYLMFWLFTGCGLFFYLPAQPAWLAPAFAGLALALWFSGRFAKKKGILWLYRLDSLFCLASASAAFLTLTNWSVPLAPAAILVLLTTFGFTLLMVLEKESWLALWGARAVELASLLAGGAALYGQDALLLGLAGLILTGHQFLMTGPLKTLDPPAGLADLLIPCFFALGGVSLFFSTDWTRLFGSWLFALPAAGLFFWLGRRASRLLSVTLETVLVLTSVLVWVGQYFGLVLPLAGREAEPLTLQIKFVLHGLPLLALPLAALWLVPNAEKNMKVRLALAFGLNTAVFTGILFLVFAREGLPVAIAALAFLFWLLSYVSRFEPKTFAVLALAAALAAGLTYLPINLISSGPWGEWKLRYGMELGSLVLLAIVWKLSTHPTRSPLGEAKKFAGFLFELVLALVAITLLWELPAAWAGPVLSGGGLILILLQLMAWIPSRGQWYGHGFVLVSLAVLAAQLAQTGLPLLTLFLIPLLQAAWLALNLFAKRKLLPGFSRLLPQKDPLSPAVHQAFHSLLLLPLAVFWSYAAVFFVQAAALTLVWSLMAFGLFVLALFLRVALFRPLSLVWLGTCLVRLVFFDLQQVDTLSRALVFLGVGAILLGMNFLYAKFQARLEGDEKD